MPSPRHGSAFARLTGATVAILLATSLTSTAYSAGHSTADPNPRPVAGDGNGDGSGDGDISQAQAVEALEAAEQVLSGQGPSGKKLDATMALIKAKQLAQGLPILERFRAKKLLARPTDRSNSADLLTYPANSKVLKTCTADFCVHWVASGPNAPAAKDTNGNDVPDYVDTVVETVRRSWNHEVDDFGYRAPLRDGKRGGNAKLDVYIGDLGTTGVFGYANTDAFSRNAAPGYLVLDNNYTEYDGDASALLKATVSHEFFHLVQFAYTTNEDAWFMEATASWMEEQVYDGANDNRRYLSYGTMGRPARSLDHPQAKYGNWVFFENVSEALGPKVIRRMWEHAAGRAYSIQAMQAALRERGTKLQRRFSRFAADNLVPRLSYDEGAAYPVARTTRTWKLRPRKRATGLRTARVNHLSSRNFAFRRPARLGRKWRLQVQVKGLPRLVRPTVLVHLKNGKVRRKAIKIGRRKQNSVRVDFGGPHVRKVTLSLANTSLRYRCHNGGLFSCGGSSKDDRAVFRFRAVARRL
ncbi:MAG: DUF6055 domain-containing protein [Nocardioides sp.]|nr:DUF6055 domain-containing protein [Nocardioides sp.]